MIKTPLVSLMKMIILIIPMLMKGTCKVANRKLVRQSTIAFKSFSEGQPLRMGIAQIILFQFEP
jgi:hypothetical protein